MNHELAASSGYPLHDCAQVHLIDPKTGKVLGADED